MTTLDRKVEMAKHYHIEDREKKIKKYESEIILMLSVTNAKRNSYNAAQDAVKLSERMIIAEAPGSNAEKRRAAGEAALTTDESHLSLVTAQQEAQAKHEEAEVSLKTSQMRYNSENLGLKVVIANLHFLAGGE